MKARRNRPDGEGWPDPPLRRAGRWGATAIRPRTTAQVTGCRGVGGPLDGRRT